MNRNVLDAGARKALLPILSALVLFASAAFAEEMMTDIKAFASLASKTPEQVEAVLGKPGKVLEEGNEVHWLYEKAVIHEATGEVTDWKLTFSNGKASAAGTGNYF